MLDTALAQLRVAASVALGLPFAAWSLDHLVAGALAPRREFGAIGAEGGEVLGGPPLDAASRRELHRRRFRAQARRAARETRYRIRNEWMLSSPAGVNRPGRTARGRTS